jgi:hypothetical protein
MNRPPWLQPNSLVVHQPSGVIFVVIRLQKEKGKDASEIWLLDMPLEETIKTTSKTNVKRYRLSECDRATLSHFVTPQTVYYQGKPLLIPTAENFVLEENNRLILDPVYQAALDLAVAFDGEILVGVHFNL